MSVFQQLLLFTPQILILITILDGGKMLFCGEHESACQQHSAEEQ